MGKSLTFNQEMDHNLPRPENKDGVGSSSERYLPPCETPTPVHKPMNSYTERTSKYCTGLVSASHLDTLTLIEQKYRN